MKKIVLIFLTICMLFVSLHTGLATVGSNIEIKFKLGDRILNINGKEVEVEATPYVMEGVTLVPVRVITEAFGAEVAWEGETQKITLNYQDVTIVLHIGEDFAFVNSQRQTLLYAPQLTNSVTMVPLRFITENFGADVDFKADTQEITIIKSVEGQEPVSDISKILKNSDKDIVGDSYYGWSVKRTAEMDLSFRSFDGRRNTFELGENASLFINVYNNSENDDIEQIKAKEMETARRLTYVGQNVLKTSGGISYVKTQYKDSEMFIDNRVYPYNDSIFVVGLYIDNIVSADDREKYTQISDSFDIKFLKESVEDLSEVQNNMRLFDQKNFKISFRIPADWQDFSNENILNKFSFAGYDKDNKMLGSLSLNVFSKEAGLTVKDWAGRDLKRNQKQTNPNMFQYSELQEMPLGVETAVYYTCNRKKKEGSFIGNDVFWAYGDYIYNIHIEMQKDKEQMINTILKSLEYDAIDYATVGILSRENWYEDEDAVVSTKKNTAEKFTVNIPSAWESNDDNTVFFDTKKGIVVSILKQNIIIYKQEIQQVVDSFREDTSNKIIKDVSVFASNKLSTSTWSAYEFEIRNETKESTVYINQIIINTGKTSYVIVLAYPETFYSEATKETTAKIVKSFIVN